MAVGGTTGQALTKKSATNYDTQWTDVATKAYVDSAIATAIANALATYQSILDS